jgi:hypothetical protein
MKPPRRTAPVAPKTLTEQNTDFTAEGSPPPGKVAGTGRTVAPSRRPAPSRTPAGIPGARRRAPTGKRP